MSRHSLRPCLLIILLCAGCGGSQNGTQLQPSRCVLEHGELPLNWRAPKGLSLADSDLPWSEKETEEAYRAMTVGVEEMISLVKENDTEVKALWDNSVEAFIDVAYGLRADDPLSIMSLSWAIVNLQILVVPYLGSDGVIPTCEVSSEFLTLAVYAHHLSRRHPETTQLQVMRAQLIERANQALSQCSSITEFLGYDPKSIFATPQQSNEVVYDWLMWSVSLTDALAISELQLPRGSSEMVRETWKYLSTYRVPEGTDTPEGLNDTAAYDGAYLMTHVGYLPTGYGRHLLKIKDAPWLYRYIRENFYAAMKMGELDLFAEFVDLLRQYGCDETNDRQLRHGSRYLLSLFRRAGNSWIRHRESYEEAEITTYDALHKPWTAISGLKRRSFEPIDASSYGAAFYRALDPALEKEAAKE